MKMKEMELLREFSETHSESAFAALLKLHLPLVYSVALRQTRGDASLAEEIAQQTFCTLAQKAGAISPETILGAWLCRTTFYIAQKTIRGEQRRHLREQKAALMQPLCDSPDNETIWTELAPQIDEVINLLPEKERVVVIQRFFEQKPVRDLAASLGISEEAVRMRISRGLEKLRIQFAKRGLALSSLALASCLAEKSRAAVPPNLFDQMQHLLLRSDRRVIAPKSVSNRVFGSLRFGKMATLVAILVSVAFIGAAVSIRRERQRSLVAALAKPQVEIAPLVETAPAKDTFDLDAAAENLRRALRDPWPSQKPPYRRVDEALARYGRSRKKAIPVLMEMFTGLRSSHTADSMRLGAHGLILLGPEAEETHRDLLVLYDSGDIRWLGAEVIDLFVAVDPRGDTVPAFLDLMRKSSIADPTEYSAFLDRIVEKMIVNNPELESMYGGVLSELLHFDRAEQRAHAAFIIAGLPGLNEPAVFTNILSALVSPERLDKLRAPSGDYRYDLNKRWRLNAIDAFRRLGDRAATGPLSEIAHAAEIDDETRSAALFAIAELDPASQAQSSEISAWVSDHQQGVKLATAADGGKASHEQLIEALKHRESVGPAVRALDENNIDLTADLPILLSAVEKFEDPDAIKLLKQLGPIPLLDQLKMGHTDGLKEIASILTYSKPRLPEAIPLLEAAISRLDEGRPGFSAIAQSVENAVQVIDPNHPPLFLQPFYTELYFGALLNATSHVGRIDLTLQPYVEYLSRKTPIRVERLREMVKALSGFPEVYNAFFADQNIRGSVEQLGLNEKPNHPSETE